MNFASIPYIDMILAYARMAKKGLNACSHTAELEDRSLAML